MMKGTAHFTDQTEPSSQYDSPVSPRDGLEHDIVRWRERLAELEKAASALESTARSARGDAQVAAMIVASLEMTKEKVIAQDQDEPKAMVSPPQGTWRYGNG